MMGFPHPDFYLPLLTYEQWLEIVAAWNRNPCGQTRMDDRLTVACSYLIAPHLKEQTELPPTHFPYGAEDRRWLDDAVHEYRARREAKRQQRREAKDGANDRTPQYPPGRPDDGP